MIGAAGDSGTGTGGGPVTPIGTGGSSGGSVTPPGDRGVTGGCACDTAASGATSTTFVGLALAMLAFAGAVSRRPRRQNSRTR